MSAQIMLILGRDGMGADATEADFDAWVAYVCDHIDARSGAVVEVEVRGSRDVQSDAIVGGTDEEHVAVAESKRDLWDEWCALGAPVQEQTA